MKDNLGQEYVKGGFYPSKAKLEQLPLMSLEKMTVFRVLGILFHLSLPKIWNSHPHKNYIFEMSNRRVIF